jgi:hypothetical protein
VTNGSVEYRHFREPVSHDYEDCDQRTRDQKNSHKPLRSGQFNWLFEFPIKFWGFGVLERIVNYSNQKLLNRYSLDASDRQENGELQIQ